MGLCAFLLYLLWPVIKSFAASDDETKPKPIPSLPSSYNWMPAAYPPTTLWQTFTPQTLQKYDGIKDSRILFAVNRKVFDVTAGRSFYGPGGPYENFAGRDASRGMAKQSFDADMLVPVDGPIDSLSDLTGSEQTNMKEWEQHFLGKYIHCGELVENVP